MTDRYADIRDQLSRYAAEDENIKAVIAIGSYVREERPADEYSDLDLIIVTDGPEKWYTGEYPRLLGEVTVSFIEPTLGGGKERRCIYDGDRDVDMLIFTSAQFSKALEDGAAGWVMNRGYRFIYDCGGYSEAAEKYVSDDVSHREMTEDEFINTVSDFFFHNIWALKKLRRGELWSAVICVNSYLKQLLLKMIEQYGLVSGISDVWHDGRFIDRWADPSVLSELKSCFAHYDPEDCRQALSATHSLFVRIARAVAETRGYKYPEEAEACAAAFV